MCLAIPGYIVSVAGDEALFRTAQVDFSGVKKTISLACVPEAKVGQYVLVHVGVAIAIIDEVQAIKITETLSDIS